MISHSLTFHNSDASCIDGEGGFRGVQPLAGHLQEALQGLAGPSSGLAAVEGLHTEAAQHLAACQARHERVCPVCRDLGAKLCSLVHLRLAHVISKLKG